METKELVERFMEGDLGVQHHGKDLASRPRNMDLGDVVDCIRMHHPFTVVLEPGDMTRYTLTFLPLNASGVNHHGYARDDLPHLWLIFRFPYHIVGAVADERWHFGHHNIGTLAGGNEHTATVLVAWISQAFSAAREAGR